LNRLYYFQSLLKFYGVDSKGVYGETPKSTRNQIIKNFNEGKFNILINFEVLTTGFDSPRIQSVFITRPTKSIVLYSQMLGRGLRGKKMGGNDTCLLIDIKDNLSRFSDENEAFNYFSEYWG
jgi:DNA repair protein RadD